MFTRRASTGFASTRPASARLAALALSTLAWAAAGCGDAPDGAALRRPGSSLILVTVDTLRADHLGAYGYERPTSPSIDRIANESILFENAQAPRGLTTPSLVSMLTGLHPVTTNVRRNGDLLAARIPNLAGLLQAEGYGTTAILSNSCETFARKFQTVRCVEGEDAEVNRQAIEWLSMSPVEPFFLWVHYKSPHEDYVPPERYDVFTGAPGPAPRTSTREHLDPKLLAGEPLDESEHRYVVGRYDGEVLYTDALIGELWEAFSAAGLLDRSLVVFGADHGEDLGEHNAYYYHGCSIYESVLHVPLLIRLPGAYPPGKRISELVELVDLTPTVLDLLGATPAATFEGRSLLPLIAAPGSPSAGTAGAVAEYYRPGVGEIWSLRTERWRYIYNPDDLTTACKPRGSYYRIAREELYDRLTDPREQENVVSRYPEVAETLRANLMTRLESRGPRTPPRRASPETLRRLESLGYLGDDG